MSILIPWKYALLEICTFAPFLSLVGLENLLLRAGFWLKALNWRENQVNPIKNQSFLFEKSSAV